MISSLTVKSLIHFELNCIWYKNVVQFLFFFACVCPIFPTPLNRLLYLIARACFSCQILIYHTDMDLFLAFLFCSNDPMICVSFFMLGPCYFDQYNLVVQFDTRQHNTSNFVLLSQDCCGYLRSFVVPYKFQDYFFQFCEKCHWYFFFSLSPSLLSFSLSPSLFLSWLPSYCFDVSQKMCALPGSLPESLCFRGLECRDSKSTSTGHIAIAYAYRLTILTLYVSGQFLEGGANKSEGDTLPHHL